jgi:hypothetical protein
MRSNFLRFISYVIGTLAIATGTTLADSTGAGASPRDLLNQSVPEPVPVLTADETIANQPIEFRTLVPDRPIVLPKKGSDGIIVEKFGVRITNNSSSEKVFSSNLIKPSFIDKNGKVIQLMGCGYTRIAMLGKDDFKLLKPGESIEFLYPTYFIWRQSDMMFVYDIPDGGGCSISGLKAGRYSVSIAYDTGRYPEIWNNTALWERWNIDPKSVWNKGVKSIPAKLKLVESR